jgi:hypothetical protein
LPVPNYPPDASDERGKLGLQLGALVRQTFAAGSIHWSFRSMSFRVLVGIALALTQVFRRG